MTSPALSPPPPPASTMRRDVLSAYAASAAKVLSWVIVSAIVFRESWLSYGLLALARGTLGLLNYTTLGLAPAMMHLLASPGVRGDPNAVRRVYRSGLAIAVAAGFVGVALVVAYAALFPNLHYVPVQLYDTTVTRVVLGMGLGAVLRLVSEAPSAVIQMRDRVARDNALVLASELAWPVLAVACARAFERDLMMNARMLEATAIAYAISGGLLLVLRKIEAARGVGFPSAEAAGFFDAPTAIRLFGTGSLIALGQLADFLYAPIDYVLINRLISPGTVARYAPAVQIDAGLLLVAGGLSAVLLPKAAMAHGSGDVPRLRRYYLKGTLLSAAMLLAAGVAVYLLSGWIFYLWLGDPLPQTRAILPLVLINTVVGGSAGAGRAILLGMGKIKPFAVAALVAGVANVVLSYSFVKYFGLGLNGIVYGTIVAVVGRCVLWQPWYVLWTLRREAGKATSDRTTTTTTAAVVPPPEPL